MIELRCTYDPETKGGQAPDGRKVKGTIHWVSTAHAVPATVRLYDHLFDTPDPENVPEGEDFHENLNPGSLEELQAMSVGAEFVHGSDRRSFQFERLGYFC